MQLLGRATTDLVVRAVGSTRTGTQSTVGCVSTTIHRQCSGGVRVTEYKWANKAVNRKGIVCNDRSW
jgi:hypothetical protein